MIGEWFALTRLDGLQLKNKVRDGLSQRPVMTVILFLLGTGFYLLYLRLAFWLVKFVYFQETYGVLMATKLVQILLYIALGISLVSALTTAMTHFYLSKDLEFQFSLPVRFPVWIMHRFAQVFMQSNWMLLLFGGPLIWFFLGFSEVGWPGMIFGVGIFAVLSSFPIFAAVFLCMLLVKIFPAKRVHQVFLVMTVVIASSLVLLFRALEPERLIGPGGMEEFRGLVDLINLDRFSWNPAIWAYNAIAALSQKAMTEVWQPTLQMFGLFTLLTGGFLFSAGRLYRSSWDRALQSLSGEGDMKASEAEPGRLSRLLSHRVWSQEVREVLLFIRDPSQWSQIFVLAALLGLCLYSITKIPFEPFGSTRYVLALAGTSMVDFICLSIASRFVFTSFSADGQAIWLMRTAPDGWHKFMRGKLLVFGIPTLFFAVALMVSAGMIMALPAHELLALGLHVFWDASALILLSLALGMLFINPGIENPLKLIVSPGGVLLMTSGLFIAGLHVFLRLTHAVPPLNELMMQIGWPDVQGARVAYYYGGLIAVEAILLAWLIHRGLRYLRRGDFS